MPESEGEHSSPDPSTEWSGWEIWLFKAIFLGTTERLPTVYLELVIQKQGDVSAF